MTETVEIFKALGDETRLRLVNLFLQTDDDLCVCEAVGAARSGQMCGRFYSGHGSEKAAEGKASGEDMTIKNFMWAFDALAPEEQKRALALFGPPCCVEFMGNHERMQRLLRRCSKQLAPRQMRDMLDTLLNVKAKEGAK